MVVHASIELNSCVAFLNLGLLVTVVLLCTDSHVATVCRRHHELIGSGSCLASVALPQEKLLP